MFHKKRPLHLKLIFCCFLSFSISNFALAETTSQTSIPSSKSPSFNNDITLKIKDSEFQLTKTYIENIANTKDFLAYNPKYTSEIENPKICRYENAPICDLFSFEKSGLHVQKISQINIDNKVLSDLVDSLSGQFDKEPENAKFQAEEGRISVFSPSMNGIKINKEKSIQIISDYFRNMPATRTIELPYDIIKPEISTNSVNDLGINSLIGEGKSNFAGSPKNRIFNIKVAIKKFDGLIIKPGEEFSFVKILGEVDGEHGYLPELVIKQNKTELDFGGGICQVSTTTFRAAVYSGLKITARRNHAYPVSYYNPQGFDSTVYVPYPDLKFINNTPASILIQVKIVGTELKFQFYGTDDGRKTIVTGPTILERSPDGGMKTTLLQEVTTAAGETLIKDTFNSKYESASKFPHPGELLTEKPTDWSAKQWSTYKKEHNI
jgi:vancomycin resistance protein YoaR